MAEELERPWTADPIEIALRRAHPGEVEAAELADLVGANTEELREGLDYLRVKGLLNENGEGFAIFEEGDERDAVPDPAGDEDDEDEDDAPRTPAERGGPSVANAAALPSASGPSYRAGFTIQVAFAAARGQGRDAAARRTAEGLEVQIADAINEGLGIGVHVELTTIEAFDAPRLVFDRAGDDSEESEA